LLLTDQGKNSREHWQSQWHAGDRHSTPSEFIARRLLRPAGDAMILGMFRAVFLIARHPPPIPAVSPFAV
jgi:hypothetical protein